MQEDPALVGEVIDETLRHQSPVHFVFQTATQDIVYEHATIPAESLVFAFIGSANRDERVFDDPDTFDIDRAGKSRHLAFARGAHYCIGDMLGKLMCGSAVRQALERMPDLHPVGPEMEWMPSFWIRGPKELRVARSPQVTGEPVSRSAAPPVPASRISALRTLPDGVSGSASTNRT